MLTSPVFEWSLVWGSNHGVEARMLEKESEMSGQQLSSARLSSAQLIRGHLPEWQLSFFCSWAPRVLLAMPTPPPAGWMLQVGGRCPPAGPVHGDAAPTALLLPPSLFRCKHNQGSGRSLTITAGGKRCSVGQIRGTGTGGLVGAWNGNSLIPRSVSSNEAGWS